jgi:hypothetical protein
MAVIDPVPSCIPMQSRRTVQCPNVAINLNECRFYLDQDQHTKAESLFVHAPTIHEKVLGPKRSDIAQSLHNLAALYLKQAGTRRLSPEY